MITKFTCVLVMDCLERIGPFFLNELRPLYQLFIKRTKINKTCLSLSSLKLLATQLQTNILYNKPKPKRSIVMLGSALKYPVGFSWEEEIVDYFCFLLLTRTSCFLPAFPSLQVPSFSLCTAGNQCSPILYSFSCWCLSFPKLNVDQ